MTKRYSQITSCTCNNPIAGINVYYIGNDNDNNDNDNDKHLLNTCYSIKLNVNLFSYSKC